jgi:hypothetical protein
MTWSRRFFTLVTLHPQYIQLNGCRCDIKYFQQYRGKSYIKYCGCASSGLCMPSKHEDAIYKILCEAPATPGEIAQKLGVTQKTAQQTLMQLALTRQDVEYKLSGRIHLFWKK